MRNRFTMKKTAIRGCGGWKNNHQWSAGIPARFPALMGARKTRHTPGPASKAGLCIWLNSCVKETSRHDCGEHKRHKTKDAKGEKTKPSRGDLRRPFVPLVRVLRFLCSNSRFSKRASHLRNQSEVVCASSAHIACTVRPLVHAKTNSRSDRRQRAGFIPWPDFTSPHGLPNTPIHSPLYGSAKTRAAGKHCTDGE